jgi:hypothetical protein
VTLLRALFFAQLPGPDAGLSPSLSLLLTLRSQVRLGGLFGQVLLSPQSRCIPPRLLVHTLRAAHPWKNTIQSP